MLTPAGCRKGQVTVNPFSYFTPISQSLPSRQGLSREDIPDWQAGYYTGEKMVLYGDGVT